MDSMRSLNTSLPSTPHPPEQLLQAFKAAALSVTNLYKSAAADQAQVRQAGYQEAIEDLLAFLDRENLGLSDGEGWKIRQWATERLEGAGTAASDSDDEEKSARSSSPAAARKEHPDNDPRSITARRESRPSEPQQPSASEQPSTTSSSSSSEDSNVTTRPPMFTFTAGPPFPQFPTQDIDMQTSDNTTPSSTMSQGESPAVSVSVLPRNSRSLARHNSLSRQAGRSSTKEPPATIGSKRKLPYQDFFDITGLNGRDFFGGGGSKRGRFA
ncbi:hypothetical protein VTN31DRAFT_1587 [Thermomyces dupontii]|uniref:uncharacterized protein n=1 Tax=Talaromyces thermophilus TaxID=28565 RepID=UPI003744405A